MKNIILGVFTVLVATNIYANQPGNNQFAGFWLDSETENVLSIGENGQIAGYDVKESIGVVKDNGQVTLTNQEAIESGYRLVLSKSDKELEMTFISPDSAEKNTITMTPISKERYDEIFKELDSIHRKLKGKWSLVKKVSSYGGSENTLLRSEISSEANNGFINDPSKENGQFQIMPLELDLFSKGKLRLNNMAEERSYEITPVTKTMLLSLRPDDNWALYYNIITLTKTSLVIQVVSQPYSKNGKEITSSNTYYYKR